MATINYTNTGNRSEVGGVMLENGQGTLPYSQWDTIKNRLTVRFLLQDGSLIVVDPRPPETAIATAPADKAQKPPAKTPAKAKKADTPDPDPDPAPAGDGLVCINNATPEALLAVNGIGPVLKDRIIQFRPYDNLEQLTDDEHTGDSKPVMTTHQLEQIKDQITCGEFVPPDEPPTAAGEVVIDPDKLEEV